MIGSEKTKNDYHGFITALRFVGWYTLDRGAVGACESLKPNGGSEWESNPSVRPLDATRRF